jgi:hypothetical protein
MVTRLLFVRCSWELEPLAPRHSSSSSSSFIRDDDDQARRDDADADDAGDAVQTRFENSAIYLSFVSMS